MVKKESICKVLKINELYLTINILTYINLFSDQKTARMTRVRARKHARNELEKGLFCPKRG
jgi:hypothetical protein